MSSTNDSEVAFLNLINFCKGLAIIWIVLVHPARGWFGWQGVYIFIVISGFMLAYSCRYKSGNLSWKHCYLKRVRQILPSYWLVVLINLFILSIHSIVSQSIFIPELYQAFHQFLLDIFLLRNFHCKTMFSEPNSALWFIPLLCGFYLIFPVVYACLCKAKNLRILLAISTLFFMIKFGYRAFTIYYLDGMTVGYGHKFLRNFTLEITPFYILPETFLFQKWFPFGLFLSRTGEFPLGILKAILFTKCTNKFSQIVYLSRTGLITLLFWLFSNVLIYINRLLWIFADFIITFSLTIGFVYLAHLLQRKANFIFSRIRFLGSWSYYIFLSNLSVGYISDQVYQILYPEVYYFLFFIHSINNRRYRDFVLCS